jgi:hypothetical protein
MTALMTITIAKRAMNKNKSTYGFLILIIGVGVLSSLSVLLLPPSITMANGQVSSDHREGSGTDKQMGICVIGASSPCNGDTLYD